jgi:hypothetical protein
MPQDSYSHGAPIAPASRQSGPTPYADLNAVLADLVAGARQALGDTFVGAYLQGSFALGDADAASDVDFMIATDGDVTADQLAALGVMHARLFAHPSPWARKLDGSYTPAQILRRIDGQPRDVPGEPRGDDWRDPLIGGGPPARVYPLLYLNNGSSSLVRSEHDNTLVVRWTLREAGIALAGPPATDLIDPIDPAALRADVSRVLDLVIALALDEAEPIRQLWLQSFCVTFGCRALHSLHTDRITSKRAASAWAQAHLDARWRPLIEAAAVAYRALPLDVRIGPADPVAIVETRAFLKAVKSRAVVERAMAAKRSGGKHWTGDRRGVPGGGKAPNSGGKGSGIRPGGLGRKTQGG